jgi:hypothetical protein
MTFGDADVQARQQVPYALADPMAARAHGVESLSGRNVELPIFVALAGEQRAGITRIPRR